MPCLFVVSTNEVLGHEALIFPQCLADQLSGAWDKGYSHALISIMLCLAFAVVKTTNPCFCGSCVHWRNGTSIDDGTGLFHVCLGERFLLQWFSLVFDFTFDFV